MNKLLYSTAVIIAMLCTACEHYDHAIADQGDRLDILEKSTIKNIDNQVDAINTSITDLKKVDAELDALIQALKATDAENAELIAVLEAQDTVLTQQIADLESYVNNEISATENWANNTFATLTQYTDLQTVVSGISVLVNQHADELAAVNTEIATLKTSISTLETSMKQWVNEILAEGYYDIATIDAKISDLKKVISDADTALSEEDKALAQKIEEQKTALEQAKTDLTAAYQKAITEAIEENNGKINTDIADSIKAATDELNTKLTAVNDAIASIQADIALLKGEIASIKEQVDAINTSITDLKTVDAELEGLIEALKATDAENAELIAALQAKDTELTQQIADLESYVNNEISATENWANATFATLTQYNDLQTVVSGISVLVNQHADELAAVNTEIATLKTSISTLETSMKQWVNETLAEGYYDMAAIDAMISDLEKVISDADTALSEEDKALAQKIEEQKTALEQAKTDLTAAYQKAITEAIEENNGKINTDIADSIKAAQDALQSQIDGINVEITAINDKLDELENALEKLVARIQSIRFLPEYSDGKVEFLSEISLDFMLAPKSTAGEIKNEHVTAFISRTKTRAADTPVALTVTSVTGDATTGTLNVVVNTENLPQGFWKESGNANIFICISDGNNDLISELIPFVTVQILDSEEEFRAALAAGHAKLEDNIVLTSPVTIPAALETTIDLNGHELSYTSSTQNETMILNNGSLTIKDDIKSGSVTYNYTGAADNTASTGNYAINNTGTLTVEANINAVAGEVGKKFSHAFYAINTSGNTIIKSGKILNNTQYAIRQWVGSETKSSDITVEGGEIEGLRAIWIQVPGSDKTKAPLGNLTIKNGKLTGTSIDGTADGGYVNAICSHSYGNQMKNTQINIEGGDFYGDLQLTCGRSGAKVDVERVTITGGTFHGHNGERVFGVVSWAADDLTSEAINIKGGTFYHPHPLTYMEGDAGTINIKLARDLEYTDSDGKEDNKPIVVPAGNTVTLDLNGKTLGREKAQTDTYAMITNKGTLTIEDNSVEKTGKITYADVTRYSGDIGYASNTIRNEGTLTLLSGTIENTSDDNVKSNGYPHTIDVFPGSITNIKGGTVRSINYDCIRMFCNSPTIPTTVKISGGDIVNRVSFQNPNNSTHTPGYGVLEISGGTFTTTDGITSNVRLLNFSNDFSQMKATISGGTFDKGVKTQNHSSAQVTLSDWLTVTNITIPEVE